MRRKDKERAEARRLRGEGMTINAIAEKLGVSKGSVSVWVRDVVLTDEQIAAIDTLKEAGNRKAQLAGGAANREKYLKIREEYQQVGREAARNGSRLHLTGCMLYWAEGAKTRNNVNFVNSDPDMMLVWMRFLREELHIENDDIRVHIHVHAEESIPAAEAYWADLLELPRSRLGKTMVKDGSDTRHNTLTYGVCSVRIYSTELAMYMYGAIQEYCGFDRPEWLF